MKKYVKPEMIINMFCIESIVTDSMTTVDNIQAGNVFDAIAAKIDYNILNPVIGFK